MKTLRNILLAVGIAFFALSPVSPLVQPVEAQGLLCDIFPFIDNINVFGINTRTICSDPTTITDRDTLGNTVAATIRFATSLIFVGIIAVAVYIVIKAAIKYIRSEGDDKKIEEAQKAIKSVFVGLIALFIGVIGLVLILVLFDATGALNQTPDTDEIIDAVEDPSQIQVETQEGNGR